MLAFLMISHMILSSIIISWWYVPIVLLVQITLVVGTYLVVGFNPAALTTAKRLSYIMPGAIAMLWVDLPTALLIAGTAWYIDWALAQHVRSI